MNKVNDEPLGSAADFMVERATVESIAAWLQDTNGGGILNGNQASELAHKIVNRSGWSLNHD